MVGLLLCIGSASELGEYRRAGLLGLFRRFFFISLVASTVIGTFSLVAFVALTREHAFALARTRELIGKEAVHFICCF
jgi:hypothetical protein